MEIDVAFSTADRGALKEALRIAARGDASG